MRVLHRKVSLFIDTCRPKINVFVDDLHRKLTSLSAGARVVINRNTPRNNTFSVSIVDHFGEDFVVEMVDMKAPFDELLSSNVDSMARDIIHRYTERV